MGLLESRNEKTLAAEAFPEPGTPEFAEVSRSLDTRSLGYKVFKRSFDIVFSGFAVAGLLIPCAILSVAIAIDTKGSPMYSQVRVGKNGRPFRIYKFRSMVADADDVEKYLTPEQLVVWNRERKVDNDPRITKVGKLIRKTSLDELPQFLNVFVGQLSIIGPRAITFDELNNYTPEDCAKLLSVPQGITGAWQAGPRNEASFENGERQRIEVNYASTACFKSDVGVFFGTFGVMFGKKKTGK